MQPLIFLPIVLCVTLSTAWNNPSLSPLKRAAPRDPPKNVKILILPGFGNDAKDYVLSRSPKGSLVQSLEKRGWEDTSILPINRVDWLQVFLKGLFDWKFWLGRANATGPAFAWYLDRMSDEIENTDKDVLLVCHSAGGWLARAALGYGSAENLSKVCGMVTLGSPHLPPPPDRMDMTRGALRETNKLFPGAFHPDMFYVTVAGDAIQGVPEPQESPFGPQSATGFAFNSYDAVCGIGTAVGDGVVPISHAHLEGATQLTLHGIFHSINVPEKWYGSDGVIDSWHKEVLSQLSRQLASTRRSKGFPFL